MAVTLEAAGSATSHGVVFAGPSGVGKTRLALECIDRIRAETTVEVREVRASHAAASIPMGALATVIPTPGEGEALVLRKAVAALADLTPPDGRLVLLVDDVHALDDASAAVLHQVAVATPAFLVATLRTGEGAPDAITSLWKDELVRRIDLSPLDRNSVETVLATVLGGPIDGAVVHRLFEVSQGNLLYLRELVRGLLDSKTLNDAGGIWHFDGEVKAPPRVVELVGERLDSLDDDHRRALAAVALAEPCGLDVVLHVAGGAALDALELAGLIEVGESDRGHELRVAHPLYGETIRDWLPARLRRELCLGLADAIEAADPGPSEARRAALLRLDVGAPADPAVLLAAAHSARVAADSDTTIRLARAAWEGGGGARAGHLLGESLDTIGDHAQAETILSQAQDQASDDHELTVVTLARGDNLFRGLGDAAKAEAVVLELEQKLDDAELRDLCVAQRAIFRVFEGRFPETLELTRPLLDRHDDDRAYCEGALQAATALAFTGNTAKAIEVATRAFEVRIGFGEEVQLSDPGVFLVALSTAQLEAGMIQAALDTASAGYAGALEVRNRAGQAWFAAGMSRAHCFAGRLRTAAEIAREVAVVFGEIEHPSRRWGLGGLALMHGQLGEPDAGEAALEELAALPDTPLLMMDIELVERGRAWVAAASGDLPQARAVLFEAADRARASGAATVEASILHDIARLGAAPDVADRMADVASTIDGELAGARALVVAALAKGDTGGLLAAAEQFERLGAFLWAAEAANEAAILTRAAGETRAAAAARQRARSLAEHCEGAVTPLLQLGTDTAVLTRREREIATLAASGLSNKEIAERLVVSSRTIENHLQRAYEKLGVRRRTELGDALTSVGY